MKKHFTLFVFTFIYVTTSANKSSSSNNATIGVKNSLLTRSSGCAPAQARQLMEFNNVSALLEQGGLLFCDRSITQGAYEVPKGSGVRAIYANSLWMGGKDFSGNLKIAAITRFRDVGNEFWPGPLLDEVATVDEATCAQYDKFYYANRSEVLSYYNNFLATGSASTIPSNIANWPAYDDQGQELAPYFDTNGDHAYNPQDGDIPWFQFKKTATELGCTNDRTVTMYGDQAYWWVFNDKGNIHTETGGEPLGMEIHAQAFAFNTDDEINDMTFYNYELINKSTQTLYNTYFGNFFDADLGYSYDDFVGCDVQRGLGYIYNGDPDDATGSGIVGYGLNPPAIGVDYFQGPFQDSDGIDNPLTTNINDAIDSLGIPYAGLGIGYGDGNIDNERFGMRKFVEYTGSNPPNDNMTDPAAGNAPQAYNYLTGFWRDGSNLLVGGNGYTGQLGVTNVQTDYMMFYDSDPYFWATHGVPVQNNWREDLAGNTPGDRRFIESSGPFILVPGAINNITIGIVYARASSGDPFESVELLTRADDKAQALFDNCFKILEGPTAPDVTSQELDKEIILMLSNNPFSSNAKDNYSEVDPFIILPEESPYDSSTLTQLEIDELYRSYKFEGYLIYQLANETVGSSDLKDPDKARLVSQVDVKNEIDKLINWSNDPATNFLQANLMVDGANEGIKHSFKITTDAFTQTTLVNHKTYYYMVMAYACNEYKKFDPSGSSDGQRKTFIQSRQTYGGEAVPVIKVIPHMPVVENGGTSANSVYGNGPKITRIEGKGNGGFDIRLTSESENEIVNNFFTPHPTYYGGEGSGPIEVKVIDPLNVTDHNFRIIFNDSSASLDKATWTLVDLTTGQMFESAWGINVANEEIFPQYGFAVSIHQWLKKEIIHDPELNIDRIYYRSSLIRSEINYDDISKVWISGIKDEEGNSEKNWIRSGSVLNSGDVNSCGESIYNDKAEYDIEQVFEKIVDGTISPYHIAARSYKNINGGYFCAANTPVDNAFQGSQLGKVGDVLNFGAKTVRSIDIVLTNDKSKWTRCPVLETTDNPEWAAITGGQKQTIKELPSLDKNGMLGDGIVSTTNQDDAEFINATGMSWFPGYVIDVESGVRLNIAFGEDSRLTTDNGKDMKWNPTSVFYGESGEPIWGGKHYLYVFANTLFDKNLLVAQRKIPQYDFGQTLSNALRISTAPSIGSMINYWASCAYVWAPMMANGFSINKSTQELPCDVRIAIRVSKPYEPMNTNGTTFDLSDLSGSINNWNNVYEFSMGQLSSHINETSLNDSILSIINVVPNPYYAYSAYETSRLDNKIKIVNLPDECTIRIYNVSGALIRTLTKSTNTITSVDWDLKNQKGVPIAAGVYLMHINVPNVGERVLKWFGALRPTDLNNF